MKLELLVVGPFEVNCCLWYDEMTGDGVIIDPGAEGERILQTASDLKIQAKGILLTHGHGDHIAAVSDVKETLEIPLYIGNGEEELLANPSANVSAYFNQPIVAPPADHLVTDEQLLTFGSIRLRVLATPGHSPGGVCYLDEQQGVLFCGDTLFAGGIGRTDFPGCSHERLIESIKTRIMTLPDAVVCVPGHGPSTTVGAERTSNPFLIGGYFA